MDSLAIRVREYAEENDLFPASGTIIAGVSGGADSVALLKILSGLSADCGFSAVAAHFDHRLRGEESDRDREFVRDLCADFSVPLEIGYGNTREYAENNSLGTEEAARNLRYAFFHEAAEKYRRRGDIRIATAHNTDDNAETMLLNLTRGAGARGLAGIPPRRGDIIRPLLFVSREEITAYLEAEGIPNVEDSSNDDMTFARNKVRHNVMPVMQEINPRFLKHAAEAARALRADDEYLRALADEFIKIHCEDGAIPAKSLFSLPRPLSVRVIDKAAGVRLPRDAFLSVLQMCGNQNGNASLDLPGTLVKREGKTIRFLPPRPPRR